MTPELHRPTAIDRVGPTGLHVKVDARYLRNAPPSRAG